MIVVSVLLFAWFLAAPAYAQNDTGLPADGDTQAQQERQAQGARVIPSGTQADGQNPDSPSDTPDLVVISVQGCDVSDGASVTLEDGDGTTARFVDGQKGIEITGTDDEVRIEGPDNEFIGDAAVEKSDPGFDTDGDYTVEDSTGIDCVGDATDPPAGQDEDARDLECEVVFDGGQYGETTVCVIDIPNKTLPNTGGVPLTALGLLGAASVLLGASVLRASWRRGG